MLARTPVSDLYLSADLLLITELEREKLIEVRNDLDHEVLKHLVSKPIWFYGGDENNPIGFNMSRWIGSSECGTVACIGGHMGIRGAWSRSFTVEDSYSENLRRLFFPLLREKFEDLTISQAVLACDFFLLGWGDNCWHKALAGDLVEAI